MRNEPLIWVLIVLLIIVAAISSLTGYDQGHTMTAILLAVVLGVFYIILEIKARKNKKKREELLLPRF